MHPDQFRPLLIDLITVLGRASRFYRCNFLYAPPEQEYPGWWKLCELAEHTAKQARHILDESGSRQGSDCELTYPSPSATRGLAEKIRARRAAQAPHPQPSDREQNFRMRLH